MPSLMAGFEAGHDRLRPLLGHLRRGEPLPLRRRRPGAGHLRLLRARAGGHALGQRPGTADWRRRLRPSSRRRSSSPSWPAWPAAWSASPNRSSPTPSPAPGSRRWRMLAAVTTPAIAIVIGYSTSFSAGSLSDPIRTLAVRCPIWIVAAALFNWLRHRHVARPRPTLPGRGHDHGRAASAVRRAAVHGSRAGEGRERRPRPRLPGQHALARHDRDAGGHHRRGGRSTRPDERAQAAAADSTRGSIQLAAMRSSSASSLRLGRRDSSTAGCSSRSACIV